MARKKDVQAALYTNKILQGKELNEIIPGFSENIETEFTLNPEDFLSRYLSPYGAGFSLEPRIFQSAWFRPHNISEEIENLFLVGAGTHPGAASP